MTVYFQSGTGISRLCKGGQAGLDAGGQARRAHAKLLSESRPRRTTVARVPVHHGYVISCRATPASKQQGRAQDTKSAWRTWWTLVDAGAWLGALGTAAAFVATQEALLIAGPLLLPIVALYASKERSSIDARQSQARVERQFAKAVRQLVALSEEGTAEMAEEVASALKALEGKDDAREGSEAYMEQVIELTKNLGSTIQEGDEQVSSLVRRSTEAVGEGFKKLRSDIQSDLRAATSEEVAALERLDARIQSLEAAVNGLDTTQTDSFRRLTASISSSLRVEEDVISEVVKAEVWRSLEPVRQLPQVLSGLNQALPAGVDAQEGLTEDSIKKILTIELDNLKNSLVLEQQDLFDEIASGTTKVDGAQWNQLGAKLEELEEKLDEVLRNEDGGDGDVLTDMRDSVRSLTKELEAIGTAMTTLSAVDSVGSLVNSSNLPQPEFLRAELQEAFKNLYERREQYESSAEFAKELSDVVVDVLVRVLGSYSDSGPNSRVSIASWIGDGSEEREEMETVGVPSSAVVQEATSSASLKAEIAPETIQEDASLKDSIIEDAEKTTDAVERARGADDDLPGNEPGSSLSTAMPTNSYARGLEILKEGRSAFAAAKYPLADSLLGQAEECFSEAIQADPQDIRSIGNRGNTLMVRAKTRLMMSNSKIEDGSTSEAQEDEDKAQEMLLKAGRLYRQILELDPEQGKAFVNWGRVICLRAEISENAEDYEGAYSLYVNASDKFIAAMDTLREASAIAEASRLAGSALVGAFYCASGLGLQDDAFDLLLEAEELLMRSGEDENSDVLFEVQQLIRRRSSPSPQ